MTGLPPLGAPGAPVFGSWCLLGSPLSAEILGGAGFDYVCIDLQHGLAPPDGVAAALQSVSATGALPLVRVPANEAWLIGRALDLGARGVVVPLVSSAAEAGEAARACRYPPEGVRSWGALRTPERAGATADSRNRDVLCIVMIETARGIESLEAICATPGVDAVYVGPRDLGIDHGLEPGEELDALIARIVQVARGAGVPAGIHARSGEEARRHADAGFSFATVASDRDLLGRVAVAELAAARGGEPATGRSVEQGLLRAPAPR